MLPIDAAEDVKGLWAAIPMPWDAAGRLDQGMFGRNVERLATAGVDGIYTTDADGEFYAIELDEFRSIVELFARTMEQVACRAQVGVSWTNTRGVIERIKACLDVGINTFHICYPYFMPLNEEDARRFWGELAEAAPAARWIHYNTPRGHVRMLGAEYRRLAAEFPEQMIGTKLGTQNF